MAAAQVHVKRTTGIFRINTSDESHSEYTAAYGPESDGQAEYTGCLRLFGDSSSINSVQSSKRASQCEIRRAKLGRGSRSEQGFLRPD